MRETLLVTTITVFASNDPDGLPKAKKMHEDSPFRISVNLQRSCRLTLEELSRVPEAMAFQSILFVFFLSISR